VPGALRAFALLFAIVALSGCGGDASPGFAVRGARVVVSTDAPFARHPDFPGRIEDTLGAALQYWGGRWSDLEGKSIELSGEERVPCEGGSSLGCYDGNIRVSTKDPGAGTFDCVEQTVLVHEVGHAVLGDRMHEDPRWMQLGTLGDELSGRKGYTAQGEVDCVIHVSVWRHPLGTP
jgi:hypothetical protein